MYRLVGRVAFVCGSRLQAFPPSGERTGGRGIDALPSAARRWHTLPGTHLPNDPSPRRALFPDDTGRGPLLDEQIGRRKYFTSSLRTRRDH
jgi:hypothetical protein